LFRQAAYKEGGLARKCPERRYRDSESESWMTKPKTKKKAGKKWSARVTRNSNALDLDGGVFAQSDPKKIAASLKRSAERSRRRKASPYQSAMSMLNFYINRAGKDLPARRKQVLERAKDALRALFHKKPKKKKAKKKARR
jgi:hypothetical protein